MQYYELLVCNLSEACMRRVQISQLLQAGQRLQERGVQCLNPVPIVDFAASPIRLVLSITRVCGFAHKLIGCSDIAIDIA
jgi:hypothetical protein